MTIATRTETFLLELDRRFSAPPERIFKAMTDPVEMCRWWGPDGTRCGDVNVDLRVGGAWSVECFAPDDALYLFSGVYLGIERPHRLVKTWILPMSKAETLVTLTFQPDGEGTRLKLRHDGFPEAGFRDRHGEGWSGGFDKLERLMV